MSEPRRGMPNFSASAQCTSCDRPAPCRGPAPSRAHAFLCLLACLCLAGAATAAAAARDDAAGELWAGVDYELQAGEPARALELLAELTTLPAHKGDALERAAAVYVGLGNEKQAIRLLREAMGLAGHGTAGNLLLKLLFKQKAYADIVAVHRSHPDVAWDAMALDVLRVAYLAETGALPPGGLRAPGRGGPLPTRLRTARLTLNAETFVTQYPPFADDRSLTDTEYGTGVTADVILPGPNAFSLRARAAWREEWSESQPQAFHAYRAQFLRLGAGTQYRPTPALRASGLAGLVLCEPKAYSDIPDPDLPPDWFADAHVAWQRGRLTLRGSYYRDVFGAPDLRGYELDSVQIPQLAAELRLAPAWTLATAAEARHFTGDIEDYQAVNVRLHHQPAALPAFAFYYGARHEFRDRDEESLIGGTDWLQPLGDRHLLFASLSLEANTATRERELLAQVVLGRRLGEHTFQVGLAGRHEYNVYDRFSLTLFLQWQ